MNKIRTIVVDDERIARSRILHMLRQQPDIEILAECANGVSAVAEARATSPDLLFLDINMPGLDGFGVLEALGMEAGCEVIFVTALDDHAVQAFEACALDYLLKPVTPERLGKALQRVRARFHSGGGSPAGGAPRSAPATPVEARDLPRFVVRSGGRTSFVAAVDIDWVEAAGNYAIFHVGRENHMVRETMSALAAQLAPLNFLRVNRSAILNLRRVKQLQSSPAGEHAAVLADGHQIPVTRSLRDVADLLSRV